MQPALIILSTKEVCTAPIAFTSAKFVHCAWPRVLLKRPSSECPKEQGGVGYQPRLAERLLSLGVGPRWEGAPDLILAGRGWLALLLGKLGPVSVNVLAEGKYSLIVLQLQNEGLLAILALDL